MPRAIVHVMNNDQRQAAIARMTNVHQTDAFLVGDIAAEDISALEQQGVIIEAVGERRPVETPGGEWEVLPGVRRKGAAAQRRGAGAPPPPVDTTKPTFFLVQLRGPLLEDWRQQLDALGVELLEYVPHDAYTAHVTPQQVTALQSLPFVVQIRPYTAADAGLAQPRARAEVPPSGERMLAYDVRLHRAQDLQTVQRWLKRRRVNIAGARGRKIRLYLRETDALINDIAALPEVAAIEPYVAPHLHNNVARMLLGIDRSAPTTVPLGNITQTGKGQIVAVADTGLDVTHPDFRGRIEGIVALGRPGDFSDPHGHGTHVAGSVLGSGAASQGKFKGAAPEARLYFQSLLDPEGGLGGLPIDLNDLFAQAYEAGARIHNNSWGAATESAYPLNSIEVDEFVAAHRDMLIVISAGNEGTASHRQHSDRGFVDWLSMDSPASAKNALTVGASRTTRTDGGYATLTYGLAWPDDFPDEPIAAETISGNPEALAAFSSRGPCDDRRIKPDVVAPGTDIVSAKSSRAPLRHFWGPCPGNDRYAYMGGTSMAAPLVAGCAALIRQYYQEERQHKPSAALLKATIINSTRWLTAADAVADHDKTPNFHQGFGCVYMPWAIPNAAEPWLTLAFLDTWQTPPLHFSFTGQRFQFRIACAGGPMLRFCLVWTDLPGRALQNDLSLFVRDTAGKTWPGNPDLPMRLTAVDADNNVEIVRFEDPPAGEYLVQITARNILRKPQDFALVVTGDLATDLRQV